MKNPFRKKGKGKKARMRESAKVLEAFAIIEDFSRGNLIFWQVKNRMLLIREPLALFELGLGADKFKDFLKTVCDWQNFKLISEAYEQKRIEIEAAAVRKAQEERGAPLSDADVLCIRQHARSSMEQIPLEQLPNLIREFDILIIRESATTVDSATEENGQLLAIGHYDGEKLEMAMYDDVKSSLVSSYGSDED